MQLFLGKISLLPAQCRQRTQRQGSGANMDKALEQIWIEHASLTASQWYSRWLPSKPAFLGWKVIRVNKVEFVRSGWVVWESDAICKPSYRWLTNTLLVCKVSNSPHKKDKHTSNKSVWKSSALAAYCQFATRDFRQEKLQKCCELHTHFKRHEDASCSLQARTWRVLSCPRRGLKPSWMVICSYLFHPLSPSLEEIQRLDVSTQVDAKLAKVARAFSVRIQHIREQDQPWQIQSFAEKGSSSQIRHSHCEDLQFTLRSSAELQA